MHEIQLIFIDVIEEARRLPRPKIDAFTQLFILPLVQNALLFLFYYLNAIKILLAPQLVLLEIELLKKQVGFQDLEVIDHVVDLHDAVRRQILLPLHEVLIHIRLLRPQFLQQAFRYFDDFGSLGRRIYRLVHPLLAVNHVVHPYHTALPK